MMKSNNKRLQFLDISKGIGMMMIVWMHIWGNRPNGFTPPEMLNNFIVSIYVPLFFVLSGYLIKLEFLDIKKEICKKTISLLRPFAVMYLFSFVSSFFLNVVGFGVKHEFMWDNIFNVVYSKTFFNGPLWFLLSLYWGFVIFYAIIWISRSKEMIMALLSLVVGCVGFYLHKLDITLPFFIGPGLVASPLLVCGYFTRKYIGNFLIGNRCLTVVTVLVGFAIFATFRTGMSMQNNSYGGFYLLFLLSVFGGSIMVLSVSMLTERWLSFVGYWGKYSLVVLCFHNFVLIPIAKIAGVIIHQPIMWALCTFCIIYAAFLVVIPFISKTCPLFFNIKK
ncbi:acyltransferase family protein [Xylanibacter muris]|uniref:Acyltransferase family protein n=2 Tax=Xylanibacter muris TaxID=2736290 RepID=A0ABX2AJL6_9BACT|nr:acyltransferase family protein [Xylanibacter muris]NPD90900.1 acyltransferase family protein [Xylanibacter muris]